MTLFACTYWIEIAFTITSAHFKVYHFQKVSGKSVLEGNGALLNPTQPTLYKHCLGSLTSHSISRYEAARTVRRGLRFFLSQEG